MTGCRPRWTSLLGPVRVSPWWTKHVHALHGHVPAVHGTVDLLAREVVRVAGRDGNLAAVGEDEGEGALVDKARLLVVVAVLGDGRPRLDGEVLDAHVLASGQPREVNAGHCLNVGPGVVGGVLHGDGSEGTGINPGERDDAGRGDGFRPWPPDTDV